MKVLVTGATGFVGRALVLRLLRDGHTVVAWVRSAERARALLGDEVALAEGELGEALAGSQAVIHLAGAGILDQRWSPARKRELIDSRVALTERLVRAIATAAVRPRVLVSASAVGYYGDRGDEPLDEESAPGQGFLAELCQAWEQAAEAAAPLGVRVVRCRLGIVLGRGGGALASMLPVFRAGLGGPIGGGRQHVPWVELKDVVEVLASAIVDERYRGPVNVTAPGVVTQREFAHALGAALHRPAILPAPAFALRAVLGEGACAVLGGQAVMSRRLEALGYAFAHPSLEGALRDLLVDTDPGPRQPGSRLEATRRS